MRRVLHDRPSDRNIFTACIFINTVLIICLCDRIRTNDTGKTVGCNENIAVPSERLNESNRR